MSCVFLSRVTDILIRGRALPTEEERNPPIVPTRGCLEKIRRRLKGDEYIGRGSTQRGLGRSSLCNTYKVSVKGRKLAIQNFAEAIRTNQNLREHLPRLAGKRFVWYCLPTQECHADSINAEHKLPYTEAYDREDANGAVPSSAVVSRLASISAGSGLKRRVVTPDEGGQKKGSGWTGRGRPLMVGSCYAVREICDGQSLASPGRPAVDDTKYPEDPVWSEVAKRYMTYSEKVGTPELLTSLALGKVSSCPFPPEETDALKQGVIGFLRTKGLSLERRHHEDRSDGTDDFRYLSLLLQAAQDPEILAGRVLTRSASWAGGSDSHEYRRSIRKRRNGGYQIKATPQCIWKKKSLVIL